MKNIISVYVDVGECIDAMQHKDRGHFQAQMFLSHCVRQVKSSKFEREFLYLNLGCVLGYFMFTPSLPDWGQDNSNPDFSFWYPSINVLNSSFQQCEMEQKSTS